MARISKEQGLELIRKSWRAYKMARAAEGPTAGREHLEEIQAIVDIVGERFVFNIPQDDGIPARLEFLPAKLRNVAIIGAKS